LLELLLPRTDAGVVVQLLVTLAIGLPVLAWLYRRRDTELLWFAGGLVLLVLGLFAIRTVH
jgi:hypothetical protein